MRIISGKYKGRRITAPKKLPVRPTTDLAKESLFNILNNDFYFDEISLLDLFSGTGNISYEFASRGCKHITAVDGDYGCTAFIRKTSEEFEFEINVIKSDVFKYLSRIMNKANVIFADPPYDLSDEKFAEIRQLVFDNDLLTDNGYLIIEHSTYTKLDHLNNFSYAKKYGGCMFSFFEHDQAKITNNEK
jgi:16S rRNA (guanine(966)-N(2))-methyltransferase RsmD